MQSGDTPSPGSPKEAQPSHPVSVYKACEYPGQPVPPSSSQTPLYVSDSGGPHEQGATSLMQCPPSPPKS